MKGEDIPVVLLHGLGRTASSMQALAWRLRRAGFRTTCLDYPSTQLTIAQSQDHLRTLLARRSGPFHLVGHSLGGLISAALLREGGLPVQRVTQMGAPNLGSPVAGRLGGQWPVRGLCGPAIGELDAHDNVPDTDPRIAAIAGTLGPPLPGAPERPHDGAVSRTSAWAGAGYRAEVPAIHTLLPISPAAARLAITFLKTGALPEVA